MNRLFLILTALVASVSVANATEYLQASSSVTQCPGTAPEVVAMDIIDAADGREGAGPLGCFDLWLRVNGADVANSNVQLCQDAGSMAKDVIISQGIVPMNAGDVLEVMMSANNPEAAMCIEAIQPAGEPLVPAIIFSMIK